MTTETEATWEYTETWELVRCHHAPITGEIRYLRRTIPNPAEPLAGIPCPMFYQAVWTGKQWWPLEG